MKLYFSTNPISFQKTFITTANVLNSGKIEECNIFELDSKEDKDYFENLKENKNWENAIYLDKINEIFKKDFPAETTYSIETKKGDCIGFANIEKDEEENFMGINLIETISKHNKKTEGTGYKGIGSSLINFLIQFAKENKIKAVTVLTVAEKSVDFYKKYGFNLFYSDYLDAIITECRYDEILNKNNITKNVN